MRIFRLGLASVFVLGLFVFSALAQVSAQKIAVINTFGFEDEKAGITKYVAAMNQLEREFAPRQQELDTIAGKMQTLQKEAATMNETYQKNPNGPIGPQQIQAKADEYERLKIEATRKQEDAKAAYARRRQEVVGPIFQDIGKSLQDFAKLKGYTVIFDIAKDEAGFLLAIGDEKIDVTKEFITFYNTKPATTATANPTRPAATPTRP
jgi:Skp family chaperone for outer membrane proteins